MNKDANRISNCIELGRRLGGRLFYNEYRLAKKSVSMFRSTLTMLNSKNYYSKHVKQMKKYKVIFADLDGTLIDTVSGETFPKGIWDMKFNVAALEAIKQLQPKYLLIVSNQGGIEKDFLTSRDFKTKLFYVTQAITDYTHVTCVGTFCESNDKNDPRRKPNPGMLSQWTDINSRFPKSKMLMIGDASGKPGQFSDSDKRTAENFGIDYMDINDFIAAVLDSQIEGK